MNRIKVSMAPGEADRERSMRSVLSQDTRFEPLQIDSSIPVDLFFSTGDKHLNVEIKDFTGKKDDNSDFLNSILTAHLKDQVLTMREVNEPCRILVLGDDMDILASITKAVTPRYRGEEARKMISTYWNLVIDFEANCEGLRSYVWYFKTSPWKRLLSRVYKILNGPDKMLSRPAPARGERDIVAASMLFSNIGPKTMAAFLEDYELVFIPKVGARRIEDIPGFGKVRADIVKSKVREALK